ncbi:MAG: C25 family cysteine peptidase [Desulfurococcaceae archaeon]
MVVKSKLVTPLFILVLLASAMPVPLIAGNSYKVALENMGIRVPQEQVKGYYELYEVALKGIRVLEATGNYVLVSLDGLDNAGYVMVPGKPLLPYVTYTFIVKGYVKEARVHVEPLSFKTIRLSSRVLPAPRPLTYHPSYPNRLEHVPDEEVYGRDKYFPGVLAEANVYHGLLGRSVLSVKVYPVQYNPLKNEVVVVDRAVVKVSYTKPAYMPFNEKSLLIITTQSLAGLLNTTLGDFYRGKGYSVTVVDTEYIYEKYPPAGTISDYPGFYNPAFPDRIYEVLQRFYNYTLALKIIKYLESTLGSYSHVLLVGNALDVPPSFYYQYSTYMYFYLDPYNAWMPTDIFYSDLDRDLVPDLFVGRIPFSNPESVSYVVDKIRSWYNAPAASSDKLVMAGGYPFGLSMMFGETALSTMTLFNDTWSFNTVLLTRTSGNYSPVTVKSVLQGYEDAAWFFLLSHGEGTAFADLLMTPEYRAIEYLATSKDLLAMKPSPSVPVVSSVACTNAAWDTELVPPSESYYTPFTPPSIGQAMLLSPAGGVAYVGSARIAWEYLGPFVFEDGVIYNYYYGATLLHRKIISTYNSYRMIGEKVSLGQVVAEGLARYLSEVAVSGVIVYPEDLDVIMSEVMKLSLLGDPALALPVPEKAVEKPWIRYIKGVNPLSYLNAYTVFFIGEGQVPLYRPGIAGVMNISGGGTSEVTVVVNRIFGDSVGLYYHLPITTESTSIQEGVGVYETLFDRERSGKVLIKFCVPGWGEVRYLATSMGLAVSPERAKMGGLVSIEGFGLDILGYIYEVELVVAGRIVTRVPVDPTLGYLNWALALPYIVPGIYNVTIILPRGYYDPALSPVLPLLAAKLTVYGEEGLSVNVIAPNAVEVHEKVAVLVNTVFRGEPVDSQITVMAIGPDGSEVQPVIKRLNEGVYLVEFTAEAPGAYKVIVKASYGTELISAYGTGGFAVVAVDRLYDVGELVQNEAEKTRTLVVLLNGTLSAGLTDLIRDIKVLGNGVVVIETKVGEVAGRLVELNNNVLAVNTSAGLLFIKLDDLGDDIRVKLESAKLEVTGKLEDRIGELEDSVSKVNSTINTKLEELDGRISQIAGTVYIMIGVLYVVVAIMGAVILVTRRKH